jgi:hypothetical protein
MLIDTRPPLLFRGRVTTVSRGQRMTSRIWRSRWGTIEGAADFLGRWGTQQDVRRKAEELGLLESVK